MACASGAAWGTVVNAQREDVVQDQQGQLRWPERGVGTANAGGRTVVRGSCVVPGTWATPSTRGASFPQAEYWAEELPVWLG